jgi:hypothetical protein
MAFNSVARGELASAPPAALPFTDISARAYVIDILNRELRPFLSRWHPLLSAWEKTNLPEAAWPLGPLCRDDLATTRDRILWVTWDLGAALNVQGLANILPQRPNVLGALVPAAEVLARDPKLPLLDPDRIKVGWRIFVENASRISTQPLAAGVTRGVGFALQGDHPRRAQDCRPDPSAGCRRCDDRVDFVSCAHVHLRPFLADWHPKLQAWENQQAPDAKKPETEWPDADKCRAAIEQLRIAICNDLRLLGGLIGVQRLDEILSGGP